MVTKGDIYAARRSDRCYLCPRTVHPIEAITLVQTRTLRDVPNTSAAFDRTPLPFYPKDAIPATRPVDQIATLVKTLSDQLFKNIEKKDGKIPGEKILKFFEENRGQPQTNLLENIRIWTTNSTSAKYPNTSTNYMLHYRYCTNAATELNEEYHVIPPTIKQMCGTTQQL